MLGSFELASVYIGSSSLSIMHAYRMRFALVQPLDSDPWDGLLGVESHMNVCH